MHARADFLSCSREYPADYAADDLGCVRFFVHLHGSGFAVVGSLPAHLDREERAFALVPLVSDAQPHIQAQMRGVREVFPLRRILAMDCLRDLASSASCCSGVGRRAVARRVWCCAAAAPCVSSCARSRWLCRHRRGLRRLGASPVCARRAPARLASHRGYRPPARRVRASPAIACGAV